MILNMNGGGGGTGKLFAAIGVTYPAGSTCTCTNGTKTLTAKDTSGQCVFSIPSTGTWTVTCTDGTNTKSQSVSITAEGQFEEVTLSYAYYIFQRGVGFVNGFTGHQVTYGGGQNMSTAITSTDYITINDTSSQDMKGFPYIMVQESIAGFLGDYSTANMRLKQTSSTNGIVLEIVAAVKKQPVIIAGKVSSDAQASVVSSASQNGQEIVLSVPLDNVTADAYLGANFTGVTAEIYDIWLE